jgi:hypothetical protein
MKNLGKRVFTGVVATVVLLTGCGRAESTTPPATPGWEAPADAVAAARDAGLEMHGKEMLTVHYHVHLDVIVDGKPVVVPANLGIQRSPRQYAALHTHDTTGIVHIESAADTPFVLRQVFTLWGKELSTTRVGPVALDTSRMLRVYRDHTVVDGDPGTLRLTQHAEIVVWIGPAGTQPQVPSNYAFPSGT